MKQEASSKEKSKGLRQLISMERIQRKKELAELDNEKKLFFTRKYEKGGVTLI